MECFKQRSGGMRFHYCGENGRSREAEAGRAMARLLLSPDKT